VNLSLLLGNLVEGQGVGDGEEGSLDRIYGVFRREVV
jgi:hypothetical protein